jgi:hypothetical protein
MKMISGPTPDWNCLLTRSCITAIFLLPSKAVDSHLELKTEDMLGAFPVALLMAE